MIRILWRTDVHLSDRAPSSRTDDWTDTVLWKLEQTRQLAIQHNVDAVVDGGDFFHVKSPTRNSHELVRRASEHHQHYPCPVYSIPGNHDSVYGDYGFLGQQPLGVLHSSGVFRRLFDTNEALLEKSGTTVRLVGIPYHGTSYDMDRFHTLEKRTEDFLFCGAHVLASMDGGAMFEGEDIIRYTDLLSTAPDVYAFGHWHKDQGIETVGGKHFVNVGSLTRGSISQDDLKREPSCVLIEFEKGQPIKLTQIRLNVKPADEVFDLANRDKQIKRQEEMDQFVTRIRDSLQPVAGGLSLDETVEKMSGLTDQVRERALLYLEKAR